MNELDSIFSDDLPEDHRSGVVAVIGRPNVGKSTLINTILGQKVNIVSRKPQTTRTRQLGIYTSPDYQILFIDTPGIHEPHHKLGEYMVNVARDTILDADVILWILDISLDIQEEDRIIADLMRSLQNKPPLFLVFNKADKLTEEIDLSEFRSLGDHDYETRISAQKNIGVDELMSEIKKLMPLGPRYYPADQLSEVNLRFITSEIVREKIIEATSKEIPHSVAVEVTEFKEEDDITRIFATIFVERDSQKGIVIGKGGSMLGKIGKQARIELEGNLDTKVYLELHVKVLKNWRSDERMMRRFGYNLPDRQSH
ncbi:GTPase Era [Anaerolineales bacterium]